MTTTETEPTVPEDGVNENGDAAIEAAAGDAHVSGGNSRRSWQGALADRWPELLLTAGALVLFGWRLSLNGWANTYYSAAAKSMSTSWSNFFYATLDPGGWITVDKPPAALWTQALSVRVFGLNSWAVLLPSVLCGGLSVWFLMLTVRRVWGRTAGLVAGAALAFTPMVLAVSRSNNPDATLMLSVVLAAYFVQRGIDDGRARWMVFAGLACGVGFLAKLLAAGLVMPGLWGAYLVCAHGRLRARVVHCLVGAVVFFAVATAWVGVVDVHPVAHRPWIGGSSDGTARDLVFGYNGFGRVTGASETGGFPGGPGGAGGFPGAAGGGIDQFGGATGIGRLFNAGMGDQVMWLAPIAAVSALAGLLAAIRRRKRDARLGSIILWSGWAVVVYFVFAFAKGIFHNYYVSLLAPALAALVGIGVAQLRDARSAGRIAAAAALLGTAAVQVVLLRRIDAWTWLRFAVPVGVVIAVIVGLTAAFLAPTRRRVVVGALVLGASMLACAPVAWSIAGLQHAAIGTFPDSRPTSKGRIDPFASLASGARGSAIPSREWAWLDSHRRGERWVLGVSSAMEAARPIIDGHDVVALGGFSGSDNAASIPRIATLIAHGELRYLSFGGFGGFGGAGGGGPAGFGGAGVLSQAVTKACTRVSASSWGGTGVSSVYDCRGKAAALRRASKTSGAKRGQPVTSGPFGGGGFPPGSPGGGANGLDLKKLAACFAKHGLKLAQGQTPNFTDSKFQGALKACSAYLPAGIPGGASFGPGGPAPPGP